MLPRVVPKKSGIRTNCDGTSVDNGGGSGYFHRKYQLVLLGTTINMFDLLSFYFCMLMAKYRSLTRFMHVSSAYRYTML